jgi:5-methylthioadenosine/S-adenosylhomocysteine deaminase
MNTRPRLVNAYVQATTIAFRNLEKDLPLEQWPDGQLWPWEKKKVDFDFVYRHSKKAIKAMKKNGTDVFCDSYFFEEAVGRAASEEKIQTVVGEVILDCPTPNAPSPAKGLAYTEKLFKIFKNNRFVRVAVAPYSGLALSKRYLLQAKELAGEHQAVFLIQCAKTEDEYDESLLKFGLTPVGYLDKLGLLDEQTHLVHAVWLSKEDLGLIAQSGAKVIHCPSDNLACGAGVAPVAKILAAGVTVGLGTGRVIDESTLSMRSEGRLAALLQKGLTHDPAKLPAGQLASIMAFSSFGGQN